jgi:hypothetical protein
MRWNRRGPQRSPANHAERVQAYTAARTQAEVGSGDHPAWRLMTAVLDADPGSVRMILEAAEDPRRLAYEVATLAAALHDAPCTHCSDPNHHA